MRSSHDVKGLSNAPSLHHRAVKTLVERSARLQPSCNEMLCQQATSNAEVRKTIEATARGGTNSAWKAVAGKCASLVLLLLEG